MKEALETAPVVTVLVPTIGRMEFFAALRRSLDNQTRRDFRVLVLDNASPPEAQRLFETWAAEDSRVEIARVDPRIPMFSNFNRGMRAVTTPFVTFFHDDDVYEPNYLEVLVGALEAHPSAAFSGSNFDLIDDHGVVTEQRRWIERTELWSGERYTKELLGRCRNPVPMPGLVFRRSAFGAEGFDESLPIYFGDFVLLMRAAEGGGMVACATPVVKIRKHSGQASSMVLSRSICLRTDLMLAYVAEYAERHPGDTSLAKALRRRVEFAHRASLLWGWISAEDRAERDACLAAMGSGAPEAVLGSALRLVDRTGLRPRDLGTRVGRLARTVADGLRI